MQEKLSTRCTLLKAESVDQKGSVAKICNEFSGYFWISSNGIRIALHCNLANP